MSQNFLSKLLVLPILWFLHLPNGNATENFALANISRVLDTDSPNQLIRNRSVVFSGAFLGNYSYEKLFLETFETVVSSQSAKGKYEFLSSMQTKCMEDVLLIFQHLNSNWSIQMLDANGKVPSGTLLGNFLWMGKYEECLDVYMPSYKNGSQGDVRGLYCVATWNVSVPSKLHMPMQQIPIKTGVCLPESCHELDLEKDLKHIVSFLHRIPFLEQYGDLLNLKSLTCKEKYLHLSEAASWFLYFLYIYFLLIIAGSFVSIVEYIQRCMRSFRTTGSVSAVQVGTFINLADHEESLLLDDSEEFQNGRLQFYCSLDSIPESRGPSLPSISLKDGLETGIKFLKCFSLFTNAAKILDTSASIKGFPCIHGIRFLSMAWVILGHTYIHNTSIIGNYMDLLHSIDNLPFQVITQGTLSVDTFFLISGFLLGYIFLEESDKRNGRISLLGLCLHRLLRILPVYMILIAFNTLVFKYIDSGPFWGDDSDIPVCKKYWWWNLLYINNFLPLDSMCTTWTWYLANDMQFFIVGLLLLHILWRWHVIGIGLSWILLICSWILTFYISYSHNVIPLFAGISTAKDYDTYKQQLLLAWNLIYSKPYCRIGPYLIGLLLACYMHKSKEHRRHLKMWLKSLGWCCSSFCSLSVIYGVYHIEQNEILFSFYNALARSSFSLGVAWVIYCCLTGNGELVNKILSSKMWIPLSRLTYCAYLFHPLIMSWYFDSQKVPLYFTHANMVMLYFGFLVVSYLAAFVISITFEAPIINLENNLKNNST